MTSSAADGDAVSTVAFVLPAQELEKALQSHPEISVLAYRLSAENVIVQAIRWPGIR